MRKVKCSAHFSLTEGVVVVLSEVLRPLSINITYAYTWIAMEIVGSTNCTRKKNKINVCFDSFHVQIFKVVYRTGLHTQDAIL